MKTYQAPDGSLHGIDPEFAYFLPAGSVEVTDAEADAIRVASSAPTPDQLRATAIVDIEQRRDDALRSGVVLDGTRYHSDDRFLTELLGMLMGYQAVVYAPTDLQGIRTMDNTVVQLNVQQITALASAVGAHRRTVYAQSWAEKDAL